MKTALLSLGVWVFGFIYPFIDPTEPKASESVLVIYRQREFGGREYGINVNGKRIGWLAPNRFIRVNVPIGQVKIESKRDFFTDNKTLTFTADPGQTYYVKAVEDVDFMSRSLPMTRISEEQAKRELARIKPMEPETPTIQQDH
ncbi:MAG: DUF2846 domain-containing protein [Cytophagales bacterium]|nr:MAG: DUF2846 domain-containing protein [Cytophagales bacterium]